MKHVLNILMAGQGNSPHTPHQRRVPLHQQGKRLPIIRDQEAAQQLAVGLFGICFAASETLNVLQQ